MKWYNLSTAFVIMRVPFNTLTFDIMTDNYAEDRMYSDIIDEFSELFTEEMDLEKKLDIAIDYIYKSTFIIRDELVDYDPDRDRVERLLIFKYDDVIRGIKYYIDYWEMNDFKEKYLDQFPEYKPVPSVDYIPVN